MNDAPPRLSQRDASGQIDRETVRAFANGAITWYDIRRRFGVEDFTLLLRGLAAERLRLPRAAKDRPTPARAWLREVLERVESS